MSDLPKKVPMPDKKILELILDKLQKKDIYGVYAEPVDPEELPDYHDVIKHPMDFATVRKKLAKGLYLSLRDFESDVFLICTNAMQYNAPDTVYYKQGNWNYFAAVRSEKRAPMLEATHLKKSKELYTKVRGDKDEYTDADLDAIREEWAG